MSSPSLPMVPQYLEMALGVKRALGILLRLLKNESSDAPILAPMCLHKGPSYLPFLCLAQPENSARQ